MLDMLTTLFFVALAVCFFIAAWPIALAPMFREIRMSVEGSCCIGLGTGFIALVAGFLPAANSAGRLLADDHEIKVLKAEADPVIGEEAIEIPTGRPEWIGQQSGYAGKIHSFAVASGPYATNRESLAALDEALVKVTEEYVSEQLGSDLAAQLISFDAPTIKRRFVKDNTYHDEARYSVGKMHENFALLQFDAKFRGELQRSWNQVRAGSRLLQAGVFAGAALLVVASVFSYLRAETALRGCYSGRLQFMAASAILAVVGVGAVALRFIPRL